MYIYDDYNLDEDTKRGGIRNWARNEKEKKKIKEIFEG